MVIGKQHKSKNSEVEIFNKVIGDIDCTLSIGDKGEKFRDHVSNVAELLAYTVNVKSTPIIDATAISYIAQRQVKVKSEDYLLPGGSAKGRAAFGLFYQYLRETYVTLDTVEREKLNHSDNPLKELFKKTFDGASIVLNSAGNHAISVAAMAERISSEFGIEPKIKVTAILPPNPPVYKKFRIESYGAEVLELRVSNGSIEDRDIRLKEEINNLTGKVFAFPTEPNKEQWGGFLGLATEAKEIREYFDRKIKEVKENLKDFWSVLSPTSSGPTAGGLYTYLGTEKHSPKVRIIQDIYNGGYAKGLLDLTNAGILEIEETQKIYLKELVDNSKSAKELGGKAQNGLSTEKINEFAKAGILEPIEGNKFKLKIDLKDIKLITESEMKLASALWYAETSIGGNKVQYGSVLPEKAGAIAIAETLRPARENDPESFTKRVAEVLYAAKIDFNKFKELSELKPDEIEKLGVSALENELQKLSESKHKTPNIVERVINNKAEYIYKNVIAILTGANRTQPLEIAANEYRANGTDKNRDRFLTELTTASPKTINHLLYRENTRAVDGTEFISGERFLTTINQALREKKITCAGENFGGYDKKTGVNNRLKGIAETQRDISQQFFGRAI